MAIRYGSEWHLLRYLGYHRDALNKVITSETGGKDIHWLDHNFCRNNSHIDEEWRGLEFLPQDLPLIGAWKQFWPQSGNIQNWDAVGWLDSDTHFELLLVEAKAHVDELYSKCGAKFIYL